MGEIVLTPQWAPQWTREQLLAVVDREIKLRERAYPRWVQEGKMSARESLEQLAGMRAVRVVLAQLPITAPAQRGLFPEARRR